MSERERARKKERAKKAAEKARHDKEKRRHENIQSYRTLVRGYLKEVRRELPFYEFVDSFREVFDREVAQARARHTSLLGIHELEMNAYLSPDLDSLAPGRGKDAFFASTSEFPEYGQSGHVQANLIGHTKFFVRDDETIQSIVLMPRNPRSTPGPQELKYGFKLVTLYHELAHVQDAEEKGHIDPAAGRFDLIEAEVHANIASLNRLADMAMRVMYETIYAALEKYSAMPESGYLSLVSREVLARHEKRSIPDWNDLIDDDEMLSYQRRIGWKPAS